MDNPSPPTGGPALSRRSLLRRVALTTAGVAVGGVGINELAPVVDAERIGVDENASFWARALPAAGPPLDRALDVYVVIVGAGLTGLSTAYHLRRLLPGRQVAVLEARRCGNGASARNGGMLLPSTGERYLVPGTDAALDRRVHELTLENIAFLRQLQDELGMDAELDPTGAFHALRSADDARHAATDASRLRDRGIAVEYWTREQAAAAIGTSAYAGALFDPGAGHVHPGKLVALWKRAAELSGAHIYEGTPVTQIEEGAVHTLTTAAGRRVRAPVLVLATNAYGTQLGYLRAAIAPVWSHFAVRPTPSSRRSAGAHARRSTTIAPSCSTSAGRVTAACTSVAAALTTHSTTRHRQRRSEPSVIKPCTPSLRGSTRCSATYRSKRRGAARSTCRSTPRRRSAGWGVRTTSTTQSAIPATAST
jgi:glycine/D-amino acid oxidase-like deaminating enzyme